MAGTWGQYASLINVNELTEYVRHASQEMLGYAQLCNPPTGGALGRGKGDTVQFTYYPNVSVSGGELDENERIPRTTLVPVKGTYTIKEYGNALEWTGKLEELSRLDTESDFIQALIDDLRKLENTLAYTEFQSTYWWFVPNSTANVFGTNNTPSATANDVMDHANLRALVKYAEKNNIPKFDGENYVYITGVDSVDALVYDSVVTQAIQEQSGRAALNGEVGVLCGCRVVKDSHKATFIGGSAATTLTLDKGHLVGADAVLKEVALAPELRAEDDDFGRNTAVAYYWMGAYAKILSQSVHGREHIIRIATN